MFKIKAVISNNYYELSASIEGYSKVSFINTIEILSLFNVEKAITDSFASDSMKSNAARIWRQAKYGERLFTGKCVENSCILDGKLLGESLFNFIKRILALDSKRISSFINNGAEDCQHRFPLESKLIDYPYTCGAFIISPSIQSAKDFLTCIGVNNYFISKELRSYLNHELITKIISLNQFLLAVNEGILDGRSMCIITDSYGEDFTSKIFGEMNVVSSNIVNKKTNNFLRARIFLAEDLRDFLLDEINQELNKKETKEIWEKVIL